MHTLEFLVEHFLLATLRFQLVKTDGKIGLAAEHLWEGFFLVERKGVDREIEHKIRLQVLADLGGARRAAVELAELRFLTANLGIGNDLDFVLVLAAARLEN